MTLKEAEVLALSTLKQVMEEKVGSAGGSEPAVGRGGGERGAVGRLEEQDLGVQHLPFALCLLAKPAVVVPQAAAQSSVTGLLGWPWAGLAGTTKPCSADANGNPSRRHKHAGHRHQC